MTAVDISLSRSLGSKAVATVVTTAGIIPAVGAGTLLSQLNETELAFMAETIARDAQLCASELHITNELACLMVPNVSEDAFRTFHRAINDIAKQNFPGGHNGNITPWYYPARVTVIWVDKATAYEKLTTRKDLGNIPVVAIGQMNVEITSRGKVANYHSIVTTHNRFVPLLSAAAAVSHLTVSEEQRVAEVVLDICVTPFTSSGILIPQHFHLFNCTHEIDTGMDEFEQRHPDICNHKRVPRFQFNGISGKPIKALLEGIMFNPKAVASRLPEGMTFTSTQSLATHGWRVIDNTDVRDLDRLKGTSVMYDTTDCPDEPSCRFSIEGDQVTAVVPVYMVYDNYRSYVADVELIFSLGQLVRAYNEIEDAWLVYIHIIKFNQEGLSRISIEYSMSDWNELHSTLFWDVVDEVYHGCADLGLLGMISSKPVIRVNCAGACGTSLRDSADDPSIQLICIRIGTRLSEFYRNTAGKPLAK